jgi:hypothetical protein
MNIIKHGTRNGYQRGKCRCDKCVYAHMVYWKSYMKDVRSGARGKDRLERLRNQTKIQNNKPKNIEYQKRKNKTRRAYIYKLKSKPCADCGKSFPSVAMDFDHRFGTKKLFDIGTSMQRNWDVILCEIEKCDIVCANCHRIRTWLKRKEQL